MSKTQVIDAARVILSSFEYGSTLVTRREAGNDEIWSVPAGTPRQELDDLYIAISILRRQGRKIALVVS